MKLIDKNQLESNLKRLEQLYSNNASNAEAMLFSKTAVLELCGWIEEAMDDIVLALARRCLQSLSAVERRVKGTHGFEYERYFTPMLIEVIGRINLERLETRLNPLQLDTLKSGSKTLAKVRNREAHTHLGNVTRTLDAPSVVIRQFESMYDGLQGLEQELILMTF